MLRVEARADGPEVEADIPPRVRPPVPPRIERERHTRPGETRPRTTAKDLDHYVRLAWDAGWRVERGGTDHIKLFPASGGPIISVPLSPRGGRAVKRVRSALRREGVAV